MAASQVCGLILTLAIGSPVAATALTARHVSLPKIGWNAAHNDFVFRCVSEYVRDQMPIRSRSPPATRQRALELLASSPAGCSEAILAAHGFTVKHLVELVRAGLATAKIERMVAGGHPMEVTVVRITDAGRQVLGSRDADP